MNIWLITEGRSRSASRPICSAGCPFLWRRRSCPSFWVPSSGKFAPTSRNRRMSTTVWRCTTSSLPSASGRRSCSSSRKCGTRRTRWPETSTTSSTVASSTFSPRWFRSFCWSLLPFALLLFHPILPDSRVCVFETSNANSDGQCCDGLEILGLAL